MAISFVAKSETIQNSGTQIVINKPAGVVAGDLMIAVLYVEAASQPVLTPPSGWSSKGAGTGTVTRGQVWTKKAGDSEPASYTWTSDLTIVAGSGAIIAYSSDGSIIEGDSVFSTDSTAPADAPSVTTTRPNSKLFCGYMVVGLGSGVSGMTNRVALDNGNRDVAAFDEDIASAGATGTRTYTGSGAAFVYSLAIEEFISRIRMMV